MSQDPELELGRLYDRDVLVEVWGGSRYSGIAPSAKTKNVLLFTDPEEGVKHGYVDNLNLYDDVGPLVWYTGAGDDVDQTFVKGSDNYRLLHHRDQGRALRLFQAAGLIEGTQAKWQKYLGEYALDESTPYFERLMPVKPHGHRIVFVFQLRPVGPVAEPSIDYVTLPRGTVYRELHPAPERRAIMKTSCRLVEPERNLGAPIVRRPTEAVEVRRGEAELSDRFRAFLQAQGHNVMRCEIGIAGQVAVLLSDLFDETAKVLYEAKGTAERNAIRLAIGQLFDYRRHAEPRPQALAILLPEAPEADLQDLLESVGIALVYEENGAFVGWPVNGNSAGV
jgi:5-methylcytosine-specific restriction protein A